MVYINKYTTRVLHTCMYVCICVLYTTYIHVWLTVYECIYSMYYMYPYVLYDVRVCEVCVPWQGTLYSTQFTAVLL